MNFETVVKNLIGTNGKTVPLIVPYPVALPFGRVSEYRSFCGIGEGWKNYIVPETIFGVRVSPACWCHDMMWIMAEPTWDAFHTSNSVFLHNTVSLISVQSRSHLMKRARMYRAVTYYNSVDLFGKNTFWKLKREQGLI